MQKYYNHKCKKEKKFEFKKVKKDLKKNLFKIQQIFILKTKKNFSINIFFKIKINLNYLLNKFT